MNIRMYFEIIKLNINLVVTICTTTFNIETLYVLLTQFTVNSQLPDVTGGIGREGGGLEKSVRQTTAVRVYPLPRQ